MAKLSGVLRAAFSIDERDLERALLRKSVDTLSGETPRCADCRRAPLIGEMLYRFGSGEPVCELCTPLRDGDPSGGERVHSSEHGNAVRVRRLSVERISST